MTEKHPPTQRVIWAVIPAAGVGKRMLSDQPKQYLPLCGTTVIEHTIDRLLSVDRVQGIVVAIGKDDAYWPELTIEHDKPVLVTTGGAERADSVLNALGHLRGSMPENDHENTWVLVHDAVRPCVRVEDIDRLIDLTAESGVGGLLAARVKDTMKRTDSDSRITETVEREQLWHAFTPQLFALDQLYEALGTGLRDGATITDESSAMELAGHPVQLIESSDTNLKITRPDDLLLAEFYLSGGEV